MKIEEIKYSLKNIIMRKTRSFLTVLSILIGITAIFALISFGEGIRHYMDVVAEEAGADKMFIQGKGSTIPGMDSSFFITKDEIDFIRKVNGVNEAAGLYMGVVEITFKEDIKYVFGAGVDPDEFEFVLESFTVEIYKGRRLKEGDLDKVLLGYNYQFANKIFDKPLKIGDGVEINGHEFDVVGFVSEIGSPPDDSSIYLTKEAYELLYPSKTNKFTYVMLSAEKGTDPEEIAERVEDKLGKKRGQSKGEEDFTVQTFGDILETFGMFINIINGILILIALVSVIVAAVNIMNTMYTAVLERTKEIGIMKAIGAKNSNILFIFVFESGFLGLVGGILGEILGYGISSLGGYVAKVSGYASLQPYFSSTLIIGCLVFAFLIGVLSGLVPAIQASKLNPTDALRYE